MTDAPDGPAEGEPERGARRSPRVGESGSPVGSTLTIVLAVIAVIAGFLILRAITDDDDDAGGITPGTAGTTLDTGTGAPGQTTLPGPGSTPPAETVPKSAATVVVANASGVGGSAASMTQALQGAGYTMGAAGNSTEAQLTASVVYYVAGDANAQGVAAQVAADMGGITTAEMPAAPPIDVGLGGATVLVMVGTDTAGKVLAELNPAGAVTPPAAVTVPTT